MYMLCTNIAKILYVPTEFDFSRFYRCNVYCISPASPRNCCPTDDFGLGTVRKLSTQTFRNDSADFA